VRRPLSLFLTLEAAGKPFCALARDASAPASLRSSPARSLRNLAPLTDQPPLPCGGVRHIVAHPCPVVRRRAAHPASRRKPVICHCAAQSMLRASPGHTSLYARSTHASHPWQIPLGACASPRVCTPPRMPTRSASLMLCTFRPASKRSTRGAEVAPSCD
jgi:hypothetical protein